MFVPGVGAVAAVARVAMIASRLSTAARVINIAQRTKSALSVNRYVNNQFTRHALQRIAERGGSRVHALYARTFGRPIGPKVDSLRRWSYNYQTKNTRVATDSRGKIITYIRYTKSWWRF